MANLQGYDLAGNPTMMASGVIYAYHGGSATRLVQTQNSVRLCFTIKTSWRPPSKEGAAPIVKYVNCAIYLTEQNANMFEVARKLQGGDKVFVVGTIQNFTRKDEKTGQINKYNELWIDILINASTLALALIGGENSSVEKVMKKLALTPLRKDGDTDDNTADTDDGALF